MRLIKLSISLFLFIIMVGVVYSGPTIINDERVRDTGATPALGRGYSIATNTFQSICLQNIKTTEPSYDFTYSFRSIERVTEDNLDEYFNPESFSKSFRTELIRKLLSTKVEKSDVFEHKIVVIIDLNSYYSSVDEASSPISRSAGNLLQSKDLPGFFSSCGSYYVRSIVRNAKFVAIFTYRAESPEKDLDFESKIKSQINGFSKKVSLANIAKSGSDLFADYAFRKDSESKKLTISFSAFGLGKNENATLISYDIDSFRQALKDAFISMQNPQTGKVISVEVVPWVENTDFQALIDLDKSVKNEDGEELLLYEKKQNLNLNAEFLAELERVDRNLLNVYYKAKLCRDHITDNWKSNISDSLKLKYRDRKVLNLKGGEPYPLLELERYLSQNLLDSIINQEKIFMYGSGSKGGASACMKKMLREGIFKRPFRDMVECKDVISTFKMPNYNVVEDYCMPHLIDIK